MKSACILALAAAIGANARFTGHLDPQEVQVVAGEHVVVLNKHISKERREVHIADVIAKTGANVLNTYDVPSAFQAYHVKGLSAEDLEMLQTYPDVAYVQPNYIDHIMELEDKQEERECISSADNRPWGIRRTISVQRPGSNDPYVYDGTACGAGVELYILDTGVLATHEDFDGRAEWIGDYAGDGERDGNGHGTHVSSSAGGGKYGLARCSPIKALKVCTNGGSCPTTAQLGALTRLATDAATGKKIVANMSLGGRGTNQATLDAVQAAHENGAIIVVAAGNSNANACDFSPAQSEFAVTVMSSTDADGRSSFSNFGPCCEVFAPGSSILGAWINGDTSTNTISGTSMASPHVAGAAAMMWSGNPTLTNKEIEEMVIRASTADMISSIGTGSPNQLLHNSCE